jgi:hypothetical protein
MIFLMNTDIQHISTTDEIITLAITLAGETRNVEFRKYRPEDTDGSEIGASMAAQVGQGVKRWRADVHCKLNESTGEYYLAVIANGKIGNTVKLVGWADTFEGTFIGNKQNNRYAI